MSQNPTLALFLLAALFVPSGPVLAQGEPEVLFDVKTEKKINYLYLIGENEEHIVYTNGSRIFAHNAGTGEKLWDAKVPNDIVGGLNLIWNEENFIVSTKTGMINYDVATGKILWETTVKLSMKDYRDYFNFKNGFILHIGKKFTGFDIKTGEVLWETDKLDLNDKLAEEGIANIYSYSRPYGDRLVVLGSKVTQVIDMATGKMLATVNSKYTDKNTDPVAELGGRGAILFYKDGTAALDLETGKILWEIDEEVHPKRGYKLFERDGKTYGVFTFKKKTLFFDMDSGQKLWEVGPELSGTLAYSELLDNGTLVNVSLQKFMMPKDFQVNNGTTAVAWGFDSKTGDLKWGPTHLFYSMAAGPLPTQYYVGIHEPLAHSDGWLFRGYGQQTRMPGSDPLQSWKKNESGHEGLVLLDPETGNIVWRTNQKMYDIWLKSLTQAGAATEWFPYNMMVNDTAPEPVVVDNHLYMAANQGVVKIDVSTGATVWESPDYGGLVTKLRVEDGRVFGAIGYSSWTYGAKIKTFTGKENEDIIQKTKRTGFFVLDDETGEQLWVIDKAKLPPDLHFDHYAAEDHLLYLSDGKVLRGVDVAAGKTVFEIDLKKELTGEIGADKGVIWIDREVGVFYSFNPLTGSAAWGKVISLEITMEHGVFPIDDGSVLVLAPEGPARVMQDGSVKWESEWDWKIGAINFKPSYTNLGLIYQYKKKLTYFSLEDGSIIWQTKERKDAEYIITRKKDKIFIIEDKNIACYRI